MSGRKWRHYENRVLQKYFHTKRRLQEVQSQGGCDGKTGAQAIELCQHSVPEWIKKELQQAINDNLGNDGKELLPMLVVREKRQPDDESFVIIKLKHFKEWYL